MVKAMVMMTWWMLGPLEVGKLALMLFLFVCLFCGILVVIFIGRLLVYSFAYIILTLIDT